MFDRNKVTPNGKTYSQIGTELAAYVQAANTALSSAGSKGARWSSYSTSHSTFEILIGEPDAEDNLVLSLPACKFVAGPVEWRSQRIEVVLHSEAESDNGDRQYEIRDEAVGFRAVGLMFRWRQGHNVWEEGGLWFGRGTGPEVPLSCEQAEEALRRILGHYYNGLLGYHELNSEVYRIMDQLRVVRNRTNIPDDSLSG